MDFLKSAVASAISKGPAFPYTFGDKVDICTGRAEETIWELHNGTRKVSGLFMLCKLLFGTPDMATI